MAVLSSWYRILASTGLARFSSRMRQYLPSTHALKYYSDRTLTVPIEHLTDPALAPAADLPDVMNLNLPYLRYDSPLSAGRWSVDRSRSHSAWGLEALRSRIAESTLTAMSHQYDSGTETLITHGASAAWAATLDAFVNPGDRVVLFDPSSPLFPLGAASRSAKVRWVPSWNEEGRLRFVTRNLAAALRGAKLLAISVPGNPCGSVLHPEDWEQLYWLARRYDVLVYLDRTFTEDQSGRTGLPKLSAHDVDRTLLAGSVSYAYGLNNLRVGWLQSHRHLLLAAAGQALLSAPYVPGPCQEIALRSLSTTDELFQPVRDEIARRRGYLRDRLVGMGLVPTQAVAGPFCFVPVSSLGLSGRDFAQKLYEAQRVVVGPGDLYGPASSGWIRVSSAVEDGRLREGLTRLGQFVQGLRPSLGSRVTHDVVIPQKPVVEYEPAFSRS